MSITWGGIRSFLREAYTDERLIALLEHAEDGKLSYTSCCCLVGGSNAPHPLRAYWDEWDHEHCHQARMLPGAKEAEQEFWELGKTDAERCERIIPIIREEMARRAGESGVNVIGEEVRKGADELP